MWLKLKIEVNKRNYIFPIRFHLTIKFYNGLWTGSLVTTVKISLKSDVINKFAYIWKVTE